MTKPCSQVAPCTQYGHKVIQFLVPSNKKKMLQPMRIAIIGASTSEPQLVELLDEMYEYVVP